MHAPFWLIGSNRIRHKMASTLFWGRSALNQTRGFRTYLKNKSPGYWIYMTWRFVHGCELIFFAIRPNATPLSTPTHVKMVSKFRWTNPLLFPGIVWDRFSLYDYVGNFFCSVYECTCVRKRNNLTKGKNHCSARPRLFEFVEMKTKTTMNQMAALGVGELWTRWLRVALRWLAWAEMLSIAANLSLFGLFQCQK